ncbi:hypothetical protein Asppvi_001938 [Aspergillus pseudoviridinutans]|uniref:Uncharacterized protein n=1 Tax=Aspergillus pseudoviridinutans TaxID=1517512 RepID=A0A9P3BJY0_9EURO|nr:uncharacterized protein Asppvi_001938 [Aspergillus pseudoviridinutans]GIJ92660.1 hypothetical protein Asppvi_001938 [Aspergillus pseudoviridinutans]
MRGRDPWDFYAFVSDYSADVLEKIPLAMDHLIQVTRRNIRAQSTSAYTGEACHRFKLSVVEDEETLSGASDDRVREEFRAQLRTLQQLNENDWIRAPARNDACLVLDKPTVSMLADLSFPEEHKTRRGIISPQKNQGGGCMVEASSYKCPLLSRRWTLPDHFPCSILDAGDQCCQQRGDGGPLPFGKLSVN